MGGVNWSTGASTNHAGGRGSDSCTVRTLSYSPYAIVPVALRTHPYGGVQTIRRSSFLG